METPKHRTQEIKRLLYEKGGVVVAPRRSGKTQALIEILYENKNAVVVVGHNELKEHMVERYNSLYVDTFGVAPAVVSHRVIVAGTDKLRGITNDVYVDESFWSKYKGPFKAAVTSLPEDFVGSVPEIFVFEGKPAALGELKMNSKVSCYGYDREGTYHRGTEGVLVMHSIETDSCAVEVIGDSRLGNGEFKFHINQLKPSSRA